MHVSCRQHLRAAAVAAVFFLAVAASRAQHSVGARIWFADQKIKGEEVGDLGRRPFYGVQGESALPQMPLSVVAGVASGRGWDARTSRYDVMGGLTYRYELLSAGVAWHTVGFKQRNYNYSVIEHGPEALFGGAIPMGDIFSARASGTFQPVVLVSDNSGNSAATYGHSWDLSLGARLNEWSLALGYRDHRIASNYVTKAQEFSGPYCLAGYSW